MIKLKNLVTNESFSEKTEKLESNVCCPFCGEPDFDLGGLKSHLTNGDCEIFNNLPEIPRI
jgi:hypothetical protein